MPLQATPPAPTIKEAADKIFFDKTKAKKVTVVSKEELMKMKGDVRRDVAHFPKEIQNTVGGDGNDDVEIITSNPTDLPNEINQTQIITRSADNGNWLSSNGSNTVVYLSVDGGNTWAEAGERVQVSNGEIQIRGSDSNTGSVNIAEYDENWALLQSTVITNFTPNATVVEVDPDATEGMEDEMNWSYFNIERTVGAPETFEFDLSMVGTGSNPADSDDGIRKYWDGSSRVEVTGTPPKVTMEEGTDLVEVAFLAEDDGVVEGTETGENTIAKSTGTNSTLQITDDDASVTIEDAEVMPIILLSYEMYVNDQEQPEMTWETEREVQNDRFEIERSSDGKNFSKVGEVEGAGVSVEPKEYTWTDTEDLTDGIYYYRLSQVDKNEMQELFDIKQVTIEGAKTENILYPNPLPTGEDLTLFIRDKTCNFVNIVDGQGNSVLQSDLSHGLNIINTSLLPAGIYYVQLLKNGMRSGTRETKKLTIQ